jgi:ribosomal subunit interface protein
METSVHTRHLDVPEEFREVVADKTKHLERFLEGTQRAEVVFSRDHAARDDGYVTCEVLVVARGRSIRAKAKAHQTKDALEAAIAKEAHRLTRMQDRLVQRSRPRHGAPAQHPAPTLG